MNKYIFLVAFFCSQASIQAFAKTLVLEGRIGKHPVLMELILDDKTQEIVGRYAYQGRLLGIGLEGNRLENLKELRFPAREKDMEKADSYQPKTHATFRGKLTHGIYKGEWKLRGKKKGLAFYLKVISTSYDSKIQEQIRFKKLGIKTEKTLNIQTLIEPKTQVKGIRVRLPNTKIEKNINRILEQRQNQNVLASLECIHEGYTNSSPSVGHSMMQGEGEATIGFYQWPFLELSFSGSVFCGGAHPSNFYEIQIFDLKEGKVVELETFFHIYKDPKQRILSKEFLTLVNSYANKKHPCFERALDSDNFNPIELHFSKKGYLGVKLRNLGHAAFVCELDDIATIPIKMLKTLAKPIAKSYFPEFK